MIKKGVGVRTNSNGTVKAHRPMNGNSKTKPKLAQYQRGRGAKILVQHYEHAKSEEASAKQARVVMAELERCNEAFYNPADDNKDTRQAKVAKTTTEQEQTMDKLTSRLLKLETEAAAKNPKDETASNSRPPKDPNDDETKRGMIEEWFRLQKGANKGGSTSNEDKDMQDFTTLLKSLEARKI
jgi:hypothetical protein